MRIRTRSDFESPRGIPPPDTSPSDTSPSDTSPSDASAVVPAGSDDESTPDSVPKVTPEEIDDVGNAAVGVTQGNDYEVIVEVDNGWFSVRTPDRTSAAYLAGRAASRGLLASRMGLPTTR